MTYDPHVWLVWSNEHSAWWRPNAAGYCTNVLDAGRYTLEEAMEHCDTRSRDPQKDDPEVMVHVDKALRGEHGIPEYAHLKAWMDELDPLLWVPPTTRTPADQFRELKETADRFRMELIALRNAAVEFRRHAHYPHGYTQDGGDSVSDTKKLAFIAAEDRLREALREPKP
jgi:hypothetical protein